MRPLALLAALALAPALLAEPDPAALLRKAVESQGSIRHEEIQDVRVLFHGSIVEESTHVIDRTYWYRTRDRSFRVRTEPSAARTRRSEHGVLGESGFWDRGSDGTRIDLKPSNRDHRELIKTIRLEREDFERILRLVLLTRLEDGKSRLAFGAPGPVRIETDLPRESSLILGKDRTKHTYRVLDVRRENEAPMRLFLRTDDHSVRKAVQFDPENPAVATWYYYFGYPKRSEGPHLPVYVSMHDGLPEGKEGRDRTTKLHGEIKVGINVGLSDEDLQ